MTKQLDTSMNKKEKIKPSPDAKPTSQEKKKSAEPIEKPIEEPTEISETIQSESSSNIEGETMPKKKSGRPKGSKKKKKVTKKKKTTAKKKRGRPPGSKNKKKSAKSVKGNMPFIVITPKGRGYSVIPAKTRLKAKKIIQGLLSDGKQVMLYKQEPFKKKVKVEVEL